MTRRSGRSGTGLLRRMAGRLPRPDRQAPLAAEMDRSLPALVLWVTHYPLLHGCLGVFRSLGRAGVPVHAVAFSEHEPVASSRYLTGTTVWNKTLDLDPTGFRDHLLAFARRFSCPPLIVCTSDDMAVFVAEHRSELAGHYLIPPVPAGLPARLADKAELGDLCKRAGVSTPEAVRVDEHRQLRDVAGSLEFPVIVKSTVLRDQTTIPQMVTNSTVARCREDLLSLAGGRAEPLGMLVQDYLPDETSEDWISHGYCGTDGTMKALFTGRKTRSWPPRGGATAQGFTSHNDDLHRLTTKLCQSVGYRGAFDLDWRLDLRTHQYHLLDFNPRVGAQFRMFEDDAGIDVVRAMHLDMSGRHVPRGTLDDGRRFLVEPWYLASRIADRRAERASGGSGRWNLAWLSWDDPRPALAMATRQSVLSVSKRMPGGHKQAPAAAPGPGRA